MQNNKIIKHIYQYFIIPWAFFLCSNLLWASSETDSLKQNINNSIEAAWGLSQNNGDSAILIINNALISCDKAKALNEKAKLLRLKGLIYFYKADYASSLEYLIQSRELSIRINDKETEILALNLISIVYGKQGLHEQSLAMDKEVLQMRKDLGLKEDYAGSYNNIGYNYKLLGDYKKALEYYHLAVKQNISMNNTEDNDMYYNNIGNIHLTQTILDSAKYYFLKGLKVSTKYNNKQIISNSLAYLGEYYLKTKNYNKATEYLEKSLNIAKELTITYEIEDISEYLHQAYAVTGNYKKAYKTLLVFKQMADSAKNIEAMQKLTEIEVSAKYEKEKQLQEIIAKNKQIENELKLRKNRHMRNTAIILFLTMVVWFYLLFINYLRKSKTNKKLIAQRDEILAQKEEIETQRDEIQSLNNTKDKFFAIIAHDLRNPIGATKQLAELLHYDFNNFTPDKINSFIEHIYKSSVKTSELLENLLQWAIVQTGKIKTNPGTFNLTNVIQENIDLLNNNLVQKNINIHFLQCNDCIAYADEEMITTIIRNILQNAIKFAPNNSKIIFNIEGVEEFWKVSIKDEGIGMSIEDQAYIFDMDYDKKKIGKSSEKGTGLGLILCKEFVELNGGIIWVDSTLDQGSTFHFTVLKKN